MMRNVLSVVAGLASAILIFVIAEQINHMLHPLPASIDISQPEALNDYMQTVPTKFWMIILSGWFVGSIAAGFIIQKISKSEKITLPLIAGLVLTLASVANLFAIKHPTWFIVVAIVLFVPSVLLGNRLVAKSEK